MERVPNIVQAAFFHVDVKNSNLEYLAEEITSRAEDQMPIKTVVRFFDVDGSITKLVSEVVKREKKNHNALKIGKGDFLVGLFHMAGRSLSLHKSALPLAVEKFKKAVWDSQEVAVERAERTFSPLEHNERYDLVTAAEKARDVMLFILKPNDLLADNNRTVARLL